ncbi:MAG: oxygen-independent coproporphyrinogen III oxidase [Wenzhouxiangella sp.]|jgi:oxygen-independent coproporphyrinogen-3 oxidase|nr:oxygen-independent coproporphyrinogen III oxidase [Wenzhouxiangella sp.]
MHELPRPTFDLNLIQRYGGAGPRYTSYPTALQFSEAFGETEHLAAIGESNRLPIPPDLSVYVHVPFCASPCFYCGCNRVITRSRSAGDQFLSSLERELRLVAPRFDADRQVRQLHLGGGTPTFLDLGQLERLTAMLREHFSFHPEAEIGLEVDPRSIDAHGIAGLARIGYNRISVGVQDLDPEVQRAVNRVHDSACVGATLGAARAVGFDSVSVDLIYGLPRQTTAGFDHTIDTIAALAPDRLSLFNYAHLPERFKGQRQIREEDLPSPSTKLAIFRNSLGRLLEAGYEFIGMDHFALPGDSLVKARRNGTMVRNFQGYSTHGGLDLISFGPSAISQIGDSFAQNERKLEDWNVALAEGRLPVARGLTRTTDDRLRAEIIDTIMCTGELVFRDLEKLFQLSFRRYFEHELAALEPLAADGLIEWTDQGFKVTPQGLLFLRAVARNFDAYLTCSGTEARSRFSRIV